MRTRTQENQVVTDSGAGVRQFRDAPSDSGGGSRKPLSLRDYGRRFVVVIAAGATLVLANVVGFHMRLAGIGQAEQRAAEATERARALDHLSATIHQRIAASRAYLFTGDQDYLAEVDA